MKLTYKQTQAIKALEDKVTTEVLYGGAAGGGKSALGCFWLLESALLYPGTRWLMGRAALKTLKETTLNTFFEICKMQGLQAGVHYHYNAQANIITVNGSQIMLKDLELYPSDPEFDSLGSLEITGAFIDEVSQISEKAKNIVKSRMRFKLDEYGIIPKLLMTCNPAKNWVYGEFYGKWKRNQLEPYKMFIPSLVTDNPFISRHYIDNLKTLDHASQERLLRGNWDYDNNEDKLFDFDCLQSLFTNSYNVDAAAPRYITADIARMGSDKAVIIVWVGWAAEEIWVFDTSLTTDLVIKINHLAHQYSIPMHQVICDEDGVGGGVVDQLRCKGFVNNSKALKDENYSNLKSQCYYKLAQRVNSNGMWIKPPKWREQIIQELDATRRKDVDKDGKLSVIPKDKVKEIIGRSPDFADALMMREWFELRTRGVYAVA